MALGVLALAVGLGGWLVWSGPGASAPPTAPDASAQALPLSEPPPAGPAAAGTPLSIGPAPASAGSLGTPSAAQAVAPVPAPEPPVVQARPPAEPRVAQAPRARSQPRPAATDKTATPAAAPTPVAAPAAPAAPAPAPSTAVAAPGAAARSMSVDERCADRSNFLTRDLCRIQACGNPALAGDPVCVRFREMEAANRERVGN